MATLWSEGIVATGLVITDSLFLELNLRGRIGGYYRNHPPHVKSVSTTMQASRVQRVGSGYLTNSGRLRKFAEPLVEMRDFLEVMNGGKN